MYFDILQRYMVVYSLQWQKFLGTVVAIFGLIVAYRQYRAAVFAAILASAVAGLSSQNNKQFLFNKKVSFNGICKLSFGFL